MCGADTGPSLHVIAVPVAARLCFTLATNDPTGLTVWPTPYNLLPVFVDQALPSPGSIMGTLDDMKNYDEHDYPVRHQAGDRSVLPMERAEEAFKAMGKGNQPRGKTQSSPDRMHQSVDLTCRMCGA